MTTSGTRNRIGPVGSARTDEEMTPDRIASNALRLVHNYVATLQEYIEEQLPETKRETSAQSLGKGSSALLALDSIRMLLVSVGGGKPVARNEVNTIIAESHAVFVRSGLLAKDSVPPLSPVEVSSNARDNASTEWCIPEWCIMNLYDGMTSLIRDPSEHCEE
jgi:hypothetical protein